VTAFFKIIYDLKCKKSFPVMFQKNDKVLDDFRTSRGFNANVDPVYG
jgi:hypothetical protein